MGLEEGLEFLDYFLRVGRLVFKKEVCYCLLGGLQLC